MARLSAESTAIVLDSTSDLPEGHGRESWRVVPLYVRFGDATWIALLAIARPFPVMTSHLSGSSLRTSIRLRGRRRRAP